MLKKSLIWREAKRLAPQTLGNLEQQLTSLKTKIASISTEARRPYNWRYMDDDEKDEWQVRADTWAYYQIKQIKERIQDMLTPILKSSDIAIVVTKSRYRRAAIRLLSDFDAWVEANKGFDPRTREQSLGDAYVSFLLGRRLM